jgi:hypothetical protein
MIRKPSSSRYVQSDGVNQLLMNSCVAGKNWAIVGGKARTAAAKMMDDARHVHAQRHVGRAARGDATPDHTARVLHRNPALAFLDEDDRHGHREEDEREEELRHRVAVDPGTDRRRSVRDDRREDEDRDAVADTALRDQLAHPHEERRPGGERDHDEDDVAGVGFERALPLEEVGVAERLERGEHDGQVARVLVDLGVAGLALLLKPLERRNDDGEQLDDDRGRDVRHDPTRRGRTARARPLRTG